MYWKGEGGGGVYKPDFYFPLTERVKTLHNFAAALLRLFSVRDISS